MTMRRRPYALAAEALLFLLLARFQIRFLPMSLWSHHLAIHSVASERVMPRIPEKEVSRIVMILQRLVDRLTAGGLGLRFTCLAQAWALAMLLRRRHLCSQLHIGVRYCGHEFQGHAWLTSSGRVLIGGAETEAFARLVSYDVTP